VRESLKETILYAAKIS